MTDRCMTPPMADNPLIISGAWYIDTLPGAVVAEMLNGTLVSFAISPFRAIAENDIILYYGDHPRKLHGTPVPANLFIFYGLAKLEESLSEVLRVRLSPSELSKLKASADAVGKTVSEYTREWIRSL